MSGDGALGLPAASGIVLAGGRSIRFGRDKLVEHVRGLPLLHLPLRALGPFVREIVIVTGSPDAPVALPDEAAIGVPLRLAVDEEVGGGPLVGLLAGLELAGEPLVIAVAGDMPTLVPDVLKAMLLAVSAAGPDADGCALEARGHPEPLPLVLRTGAATDAVRRLVASGERRLGAVRDVLRIRRLAEWEWRALDPDSLTLRDVDVPDDLVEFEGRDGGRR